MNYQTKANNKMANNLIRIKKLKKKKKLISKKSTKNILKIQRINEKIDSIKEENDEQKTEMITKIESFNT